MMGDVYVRTVQLPQQGEQGRETGLDGDRDSGVPVDAGVLPVATVVADDAEPEVGDSPELDIETYVRALFKNTWGHDEVPESLVVWMQAQLSLLWKGQMALDASAKAALEALKWHDTSIGVLSRFASEAHATFDQIRETLKGEDGVEDRLAELGRYYRTQQLLLFRLRRTVMMALAFTLTLALAVTGLAAKNVFGW